MLILESSGKKVANQVSRRSMGWRQPGQHGKCLNGAVRRKLDTSRDSVVGNLVLLMPGCEGCNDDARVDYGHRRVLSSVWRTCSAVSVGKLVCGNCYGSVATAFEAHFHRDYVDLQMTIPHLEFEHLARLHAKLIAQRLRNDDASGAINGSPHGMSLPLVVPNGVTT
jgi:hypothetical protein